MTTSQNTFNSRQFSFDKHNAICHSTWHPCRLLVWRKVKCNIILFKAYIRKRIRFPASGFRHKGKTSIHSDDVYISCRHGSWDWRFLSDASVRFLSVDERCARDVWVTSQLPFLSWCDIKSLYAKAALMKYSSDVYPGNMYRPNLCMKCLLMIHISTWHRFAPSLPHTPGC